MPGAKEEGSLAFSVGVLRPELRTQMGTSLTLPLFFLRCSSDPMVASLGLPDPSLPVLKLIKPQNDVTGDTSPTWECGCVCGGQGPGAPRCRSARVGAGEDDQLC